VSSIRRKDEAASSRALQYKARQGGGLRLKLLPNFLLLARARLLLSAFARHTLAVLTTFGRLTALGLLSALRVLSALIRHVARRLILFFHDVSPQVRQTPSCTIAAPDHAPWIERPTLKVALSTLE